MSFEDLGLHETILRAVRREGYLQATPIQAQAIPQMLTGGDVIACAQTGTGKTAAFALPILHRLSNPQNEPAANPTDNVNDAPGHSAAAKRRGPKRLRAVVLCPTRELAVQIGDSFKAYGSFSGLRCAIVYGGVSQRPQVQALRSGAAILVATPGRLIDLMGQGHIDFAGVEALVLDEADRMLDMGFLPALKRIIEKLPRARQTVMFSATMPEEIRRLAAVWLRTPTYIQVAPASAPAEGVTHSVFYIETKQKPALLAHFLKNQAFSRAIVFARTKHGADKLVRRLTRDGIHAAAIHGNKTQAARQRTLAEFKSNRPPVLIATDIAARGLDIDAVSHVINYDLPDSPDTYVHRIGRTGRAGAEGAAISFCGRDERALLRTIERQIRRPIKVEAPIADLPDSGPHPSDSAAPPANSAGQRPGAPGSGGGRPGGQRPPYASRPKNKGKSGAGHSRGKFSGSTSGPTGNATNKPGQPFKRRRRGARPRVEAAV